MRKSTYPATEFVRRCAALPAVLFFLSFTNLTEASRSVVLEWDLSPESDIAGYRLQYGTAPGVYDRSVEVRGITSASLPDLADDREYYVAVVAFNSSGAVSEPSNEVLIPIALPLSVTYEDWSAVLPAGSASMATADPDGDGLTNLMEFATGRSPLVAETSPVVELKIIDSGLRVRLAVPLDRANVQTTLQESADLVTWTTVTDAEETLADAQRVHTVRRELTGDASRFFRVATSFQQTP